MKKTITNSKEAIEALGGVKPVAEWLETTTDNVLMMRHRGYIARGYHLHFWVTLKDRGHQFTAELFGLDSLDRLVMPKAQSRKKAA